MARATPSRLLPAAAVGHLAHDLRGCIHVIRGHAELLRAESVDRSSHESATYIVDASRLLGGLCEDVVDFLRLPDIARADPVVLHVDELDESEHPIHVHPVVQRVVDHVLAHVRSGSTDAVITAVSRTGDAYLIAVEPVTVDDAQRDGIIALATGLLVAHGGDLFMSGGQMELLVPSMSEAP